MIWIYEQGFEDFATNGLGSLTPARCFITEEQGGSYELELEHPMDESGVFDLLKTGRVIKAPVPAQTTPFINIDASEGYEVWETNTEAKVYTKQSTSLGSTVTVNVPAQYDTKKVRPGVVHMQDAYTTKKWKPNGNRVLETVGSGTEVSVLLKDGSWYKITTPNGNTGWAEAAKIDFVQTIASVPPETIQARKTRDQLFRIYRAEKDTGNKTVKVWARHISYDLLANVIIDCVLENVAITAAIATINANCTQDDHGFSIYTDSTATITADYSRKGILEALLDPDEGIMALANLRMVRDNYDIFLLERSETSRQAVTYGYNLLGVNVDISEDSIVNRIVPVGKTADGEPLHIDEVYVDSPRNNEATLLRASVIEYDVKESDDLTLANAKIELTALANADFEAGVDLPDISVRVDFLQLGDTEEYIAYRDMDRLYLGDIVTVNDEVHGVVLDAEVVKIEYDPVTGSYLGMEVGVTDASRTIGSLGAFMLPDGSIRGYKLLPGSVDGSRLGNLSVTAAKIGLAVIDTAHIKNAAITNALISNATIETAKIKDAAITSAKIGNLEVKTANIDNLAVDNAKIANATIETAKIKDAQITNAKIASAGIDFLKVKNSVLDTAIFRESVVGGDVYIDRLRVAEANITSLTVGDLIIKDPDDGTLHRLYVDDGVIKTELIDILYQNLSDDALLKVSEWTVHKSEDAPDTPYVNQLWIKPSTGIMQKCLTIVPTVTWGDVKAGELHTSYIDAVTKGLNILTGGEMNILSGGALTIKALGDEASIIDMDNTGMTISSTGLLSIESGAGVSVESGGEVNIVGGSLYLEGAEFNVLSTDVDIDTDTFDIHNGPNAMLYLDEDEMVVSAKLLSAANISGNVVNTMPGGEYYTYFGSAQASINNIPKYLKSDLRLWLPSDAAFYEDLLIEGFCGAKLTIVMQHSIYGHVTIKNCSNVKLDGGAFNVIYGVSDRALLDAENVGMLELLNIRFQAAAGATYPCVHLNYTKFYIQECDFVGPGGIYADYANVGHCKWCSGTLSAYGLAAQFGSHVGYGSYVPVGSTANTIANGGTLVAIGSPTPTASIYAAPTAPSDTYAVFDSTAAGVMAVIYRRTGTRSKSTGAYNWDAYSVNSYIDWAAGYPRQGTVTMAVSIVQDLGTVWLVRQDQFRYVGLWILPAITSYGSAKAAYLTLTRHTTGGVTGAATVHLNYHVLTSFPSGHAYTMTDTGQDISMSMGETVTVTMGVTALTAIQNGVLKGFGVTTNDPSVHMGMSISLNVHY